LFLGVFIAWLFYFREEVFLKIQMRKFPLVIIAVVTLSLSFLKLEENLFVRTFGFAAISIGAACLLILLLELRFSRSNPLRLVEMLGVHSYSVYLWHLAGKAWFFPEGFAESSWFLYVVSYLSCTLFLGIGFSKLLEIPVLRFRDYFFPHPQKATSAV
jgi:peptidoglycan/LPS O-acetylase OafA/YrhL